MNNQQFRRLLLSDTQQSQQQSPPQQNGAGAGAAAARTPGSVLGARKQSSIPMTPRQVGRGAAHADFARQLAERNAKDKPAPKTRTTAPKGTRLAAGYTDRTKQRGDDIDLDLVQRIKNLDEAMKLGQIDRDMFEKLVLELTAGDVSTTHLVKGLDRKLLERVRRGEDVLRDPTAAEDTAPDHTSADDDHVGSDVEDAFDELAQADVGPVMHTKVEKKGTKLAAPPPPPAIAGVKRTRADILAELKRQREEAARAAAEEHEKKYPTLGPGFRKVDPRGESTRIEIDAKGREVLIITGPDGKEKRKVRKQKAGEQPPSELQNDGPNDASKPTKAHSLPPPKEKEKESDDDDDDIFEGVGSNYNPLADLGDDDDDDDADDSEEETAKAEEPSEQATAPSVIPETTDSLADSSSKLSPPSQLSHPARRNYFASTNTTTNTTIKASEISAADATVRAALAKVRNLDEKSTLLQGLSTDPDDPSAKETRLKKRAAELAASDRDMEDMDLGFGESRFDDADEMEREGEKVKFSEWKGLGAGGADEEGEEGPRDAKKRKRGPKKRKGDKNNPDDIFQAMERQKEKKNKTLG